MEELPDDILSFTLSLLPMRDAARTSVLARRWRNLWKMSLSLSTNISFDVIEKRGGRNFPDEMFNSDNHNNEKGKFLRKEKRKYIKWVNRMLKQCSNRVINSFRLRFHMSRTSADHIDQWLRSAITKKAHDFELDFSHLHPDNFFLEEQQKADLYVFPYWLFSQEPESLLNRLRLNFCRITIVDKIHYFCFRTLVDLQLDTVAVSQDDLDKLLSNCSSLENLSLIYCLELQRLQLSELTPKLKRLTVCLCHYLKDIVVTDAKNLTKFEHGGFDARISLNNVPNLSDVTIVHNRGDFYAPLVYALGELSTDAPNITALMLSVISKATVVIPKQMPLFANLKKLVLKVTYFEETLWDCILIIMACPYLQSLDLHLWDTASDCDTPQPSFDFCDFHHLKEITITGFHGTSHEMEFTKCLIERSTSLENLIIHPEPVFYDHVEGFYAYHEVEDAAASEEDDTKKEREIEMRVRIELADVLQYSTNFCVVSWPNDYVS